MAPFAVTVTGRQVVGCLAEGTGVINNPDGQGFEIAPELVRAMTAAARPAQFRGSSKWDMGHKPGMEFRKLLIVHSGAVSRGRPSSTSTTCLVTTGRNSRRPTAITRVNTSRAAGSERSRVSPWIPG